MRAEFSPIRRSPWVRAPAVPWTLPGPEASWPLKPQWFQILLSLAEEDLHGSAIMEDVLERTDGQMKLWPGTLYGSLSDMDDAGLIAETDPPEDAPTEGGKRRFYTLTGAGREVLAAEVRRLAGFIREARAKNMVDDLEPA